MQSKKVWINPVLQREKKVISPYPDIEIPDLPVHTLVFRELQKAGDRVSLIDGISNTRYSAKQLRASCLRVANGLRHLGLRQGETLSVYSGNSIQFTIMFLGTLAAGGTFNTVNSNFKEGELVSQLADVQASWIYTTVDLLPVVQRVIHKLPKLKGIILDRFHPKLPSFSSLDAHAELSLDSVSWSHNPQEDTAAILYSSGTTGLPKGAMLTHRNIVSYAYTMGPLRHDPDGLELLFLPLYHVYGLASITVSAFINTVPLVLLPGFQPEDFLSTIQRHKVTSVPLVPPTIVFLAKNPLVSKFDLSSMKSIWSGAAPLGTETEELLHQRLPHVSIKQCWGMTETSGAGLVTPRTLPNKSGVAGVVAPSSEIKVVDPISGEALGPHEVGEILCRGPYVMKGYFHNEEATRKMIDQEGWLHTGDSGYYDKDGYFFIVDRIKDLIKYKASQVAPAELEALILGHPAVADVGVIGIPDPGAGELPRAFVVVKDGHQLVEAELQEFVAERVANFKQLRGGVIFVKEIPKSPSGKILKRTLRQMPLKPSKL